MNNTIKDRLEKIERVSNVLRGVTVGLLWLTALATCAGAYATIAGRADHIASFSQTISLHGLGQGARVIVAIVLLLTGGIGVKGLYHLKELLENFANRAIFTVGSARQIKLFGISCILWGTTRVLWAVLPALLSHEPGMHVQVVPDALFIGGVIVAVSWFAELAAAIDEENQLTI